MALPRQKSNADHDPYTYRETAEEARERSERLVALLESWINVSEEEAEEQRETGEYLATALDEDRPEDQKLFPEGWESHSPRGRLAHQRNADMREQIQSPHPDTTSADREKELARQAKALAAYVDEWTNVSEEDAKEQQETLEYLIRALDEDRLSDRKLFPE